MEQTANSSRLLRRSGADEPPMSLFASISRSGSLPGVVYKKKRRMAIPVLMLFAGDALPVRLTDPQELNGPNLPCPTQLAPTTKGIHSASNQG
jgi:hypothetical protein